VDWNQAITQFVTLVISLTVHEAAHAWFAMLGGDRTAYLGGQVTLNPVPHMRREPFGMLLFPLISLLLSGGQFCLGFASTPINSLWAARNPKKAALMAAAGPLSNLLLAAIAFAVLAGIGRPQSNTTEAIQYIAFAFLVLNIWLCLFNLLPLPPLDGASVLEGLVPSVRGAMRAVRGSQAGAIIALIVAIKVMPLIAEPVLKQVFALLRGFTGR
jgi:Zn-dependent protease